MAQAKPTVPMATAEQGGLDTCSYCGGGLTLVGGTDPAKTDEMGGFEETYRCTSCGDTGRYTYRYADSAEGYAGVCANTEMEMEH